jgi:starch-binding outer membrane protein SusE/F
MKNISKLLFAIILIIAFGACKKIADLPHYANGATPTLTASTTTIAPTAADSSKTVLTLSWSNPKYATDSSLQKFIVEMDSAGRNFTHEVSFEVDGPLNVSFTGNQLNNVLAGFGFSPGSPFSVDIRLTSSYANNNEQYRSNVVTVTMTPYLVPIVLTPSSTSPIVLNVSNATSNAISFNWNASGYGNNTISYALQLDTAGDNFAHPQVIKYDQKLTSSILVNDLNSMAIAAGVSGGSTKKVEFRIVSYLGTSYATPLVNSSVVSISITTFTPIPPTLYIVGDATAGGWNNPVPIPSQQFTRLDAVSYGIVVNLTAGKSYLLLPVNGDWSHKYGGASATGGALLADNAVPGSNTPAPATTGNYQIVVNFQTGTYTVTPFATTIPSNLYIVGDATAGGWNNPVPVPSQQFTQIDAVSFGIIVDLTAGGSYLFLPLNGDWGHKFGGSSATGGTLLADNAVPGSNTPAPAASGTYQIIVNFQTGTYKVTPFTGALPVPTNLYIVGDATAGGWNNPVPVPSQQFTRVSLTDFQLTINLSSAGSYLFLPLNGDWGHKYGGTSATGSSILYDNAVPGSNTPGPAVTGNYLIDVDFAAGKYTVTKQ